MNLTLNVSLKQPNDFPLSFIDISIRGLYRVFAYCKFLLFAFETNVSTYTISNSQGKDIIAFHKSFFPFYIFSIL